MSEIQTNESAQIQKNASLFGHFYVLLQKAAEVFIVSGPVKSGKSVTVDLLTDKTLQQQEDDDGRKFVSQEKNYETIYGPIYFQYLEQSKTLVLEGFTLDYQKSQNAETKLNLVKAVFVKSCLTAQKRVSLIILADSQQRQQQENLNILLEHMFECLSIKDQKIIKGLSKNIHLLLTKTEEEDAVQQFKNICSEIQEKAQNQGVKDIISAIHSDDKVRMFPNDDPQGLGQKLRQQFKPKQIQKSSYQFLKKSNLNQSLIKLLRSQKQEVIRTFNHFLSIINVLAKYLLEKHSDQKEYQKTVKKLYKQSMKSELSLQNLKKTSLEGLKKLPAKQKISRQQIQKQKGIAAYQLLIEYILTILRQLQAKADKKEGYQCLIGTIKFIKEVSGGLEDKTINENIGKFMQHSKNCEKFFLSSQAPPKKQEKKTTQKKQINKAANIFKQQVLPLSNNEEVIKFCINKTKQKSQSQNFEVNDVIYHLKFLRELLESYDASSKVQNRYFIQQLLELYAFNENIYEFQTNVKKYVQKKEIPLSSIQKLIKKADQIKSYESQLRLINYAIANTFEDQQFRFLNKMKSLVKQKQHEQYLARSQNKQSGSPEKKQFILPVSLLDEIKQKAQKNWLQSQSFRKLIQRSEE